MQLIGTLGETYGFRLKGEAMPPSNTSESKPHPDKPIRRFDVFAEYNRLDALKDGRPADQAKGHGIWLAKVVASRRNRTSASDADGAASSSKKHHLDPVAPFKSVGDELQTAETFDHDIIARMGARFYAEVFAPAIADAFADGKKYEEIRDTIRATWKPGKST
ncbi:MAG TPA: hypothetical protein PK691_12145 [Thermomicrobiales bacterium]|nr:hypothetical protein [Thermomicrobiales bacterium]